MSTGAHVLPQLHRKQFLKARYVAQIPLHKPGPFEADQNNKKEDATIKTTETVQSMYYDKEWVLK